MQSQKRQFRALFRLSLVRLIDLEILSSRGDLQGLYARTLGLLLGLSLMLVLMVVAPYARIAPALRPLARLHNDGEFFISITLVVIGLFSVLAWNNLLPDRRDCLVLSMLPLRTRTMASARLAAVLTCIFLLVAMVNAFTGLTFPYIMAGQPLESFRCIAAWWITMLAAGIFAFAWTLAVQGISAQLFPWHTFLRVSAALQMGALFVALGLFFLTPPFTATMTTRPDLGAWLPSYWFTGLLGFLKGDRDPMLRTLAMTAGRNLTTAVGLAGSFFALSWFDHMRTIVEAPDMATGGRQTLAARCGTLFVKAIFRRPLDRAVVLFTARTAARSRQHRLLLAAYGGIGLALAVAFAKGLFNIRAGMRWNQPNIPLLVVAVLPLICAIRATRSVFALPHSLSANWIFRITAVQSPAKYFEAVRKSMIVVAAAPAAMASIAPLLFLWSGRYAIAASLVLVMLGSILVDSSLYQFRKIPFACSWLPASGQSLSTVRALGYAIGFLAFASALAGIELWAIRDVVHFLILAACLGAWAFWLRHRGRDYAASPANALQFDDEAPVEILSLDLRRDGAWSGEQAWVDTDLVRAGHAETPSR